MGTSERWRANNPALRGRTLTMRGGAVTLDERGFLPVDMSPEQLEHARHSGLFDPVKVTRASIVRDELAARRTKLEETERSARQAAEVFKTWRDKYEKAVDDVAALEDELVALDASPAAEPEVPIKPLAPVVDLDDWEQLKELAHAHDIPVARRKKDEIKADVATALAAKADAPPAPPAGDGAETTTEEG